jgi:DNA polymerase-4
MFVSMHPGILHADVDAFYASVAQRDDPALRGRPVIVGSWVVMAASYEARAHGVRGGMSTARARRQCPGAVVVEACWPAYVESSRTLFEVFRRFTDIVEPGSMEEAFLDVTHAAAPAAALAAQLRREVREEAGLPLSVGVARTKVLAKMASRSAKPDGLFVVAPEREVEFLHPLPVERLWGVGPATARRLHARGLRTVGQAAELGESELMAILGKASGRYVHAIAHNREHRPVQRRRGRRSFGAQRALRRGVRPRADLDAALADLADRVTRRMQRKGRAGRTVVLRLRFADYTRASRSCTLGHATAEAGPVAAATRALLDAAMPIIEERGITLIGVTVTNLDGAGGARQLTLPLSEDLGTAASSSPVAPPPATDESAERARSTQPNTRHRRETPMPTDSAARHELVITRVFDAPRERVYAAFTDADALAHWFGPVGFSVPRETVDIDARAGGHQRLVMVSDEDPGVRAPVDARFTEVVENELLVGTEDSQAGCGDQAPGTGTTLRLEFHDDGGATRLVVRQGPYSEEMAAMADAGWESSFTKLDRLLAA